MFLTRTRVFNRTNLVGPRALARCSFSALRDADVSHFRSLLGDAGVVTDDDRLAQYNTDWMRKYHGKSRLALRPASTEQVSHILRYCNERDLAVVPQGGNTGLVGGSVPLNDEIVLSLSRMNKVRNETQWRR